ncbi:PaaI family thioesterase [Microbacterium sp. STN6]|uniref:PaaI family thioesterase n=1 Tax=Microbacterium sp. STN6 TaxID=2995588 RepID=UPI002260B060|nr:PaaI family thioesterase [Microbacterium sp. STN6]MCX7522161.1 PaaI family thioesterase [Microbacterium sp. STN6]
MSDDEAARQPGGTSAGDASAGSRVVTWQDPFAGARLMPAMTGLEFVRGMIDGSTPAPAIADLARMRVVAADVGSTTFECDPHISHYNPIGTVHGGLIATILDSAVGCAVHTTLPKGQGYTSVDIRVSFLRPVRLETGTLTCTATVTKAGRRVAFAEATLTDAAGTLYATASSSLLVLDLDTAGETVSGADSAR